MSIYNIFVSPKVYAVHFQKEMQRHH